jgi:hypothetical protein
VNRLSIKARGKARLKALHRAVTLPQITPKKGETWIA